MIHTSQDLFNAILCLHREFDLLCNGLLRMNYCLQESLLRYK